MPRFVVVPQWQGSPSARAMLLVDGADAIAGDLPRSATVRVDVPLEAGESQATGVQRHSSLVRTRELVRTQLEGATGPALVVGGDCGVAVSAVAHSRAVEPDLAVLWFDAHPDLHTPDTSPSGAFSGMALRAILGGGPPGLALGADAIAAQRAVLVGARAFDDGEEEELRALGLTWLPADAAAAAEKVASAVRATGAAGIHVHVDLDVLDPSALTGLTAPAPFGLTVAQLVAAIAAAREAAPLVGASLSGFAPAAPDAAVEDLGAILRIVGALA
ncbi:arginase family protein [Microbacterium aureliae]